MEAKEKKSMKIFLILIAGQFISSVGSGLTDFGLAIYVLDLTKSVTATAVVSIAAFLPLILFTPLGGVLADRYDRRLLMILGELLSGCGLVICLLSIWSGHPSMVVICIGVAISSLFSALMEPAFKATITDMVSKDDFAKAGGLVQIAGNAKLLISPMLAGALLTCTTVSTLMIIDIGTFFTTALTIVIVRKHMGKTKVQSKQGRLNIGKEFVEGLQALNGAKGIWSLVWIMTLAVFCLGFVQILSKPLVLAFASESELGILTTVVAVGMLIGSILIGCLKKVKSYQRLLALGLIGCGFFMALMALLPNIVWIAGSGLLMFVCMPIVQIGAEVMVRRNLRNEVQGRAFGVIGFVSQMGYIVAYLCSGVLSDCVFEPLMRGESTIAHLFGRVIGYGNGRGVALLIEIAGICLVVVGFAACGSSKLKRIDT